MLSLESPALLSSDITTNHSSLAIEVLGNLLERGVLGLNVVLPDDSQLDGEPAAVDDVVPPLDVLESDGVDVLIEEEGDVDHEEDHGHTLGTNVVRQNLDAVSDEETGPGQVVEDVVDEDHDDYL